MSVKSGRAVRLGMAAKSALIVAGLCMLAAMAFAFSQAGSDRRLITPTDPGVRGGGPGAGQALSGLSSTQTQTFTAGQTNFTTPFVVPDPANSTTGGLGPVFNSNSCSSCHAQPAAGGDTPDDLPGASGTNELFSVYQLDGATNTMPSFETTNGPELVARFPWMLNNPTVPDGSVHQLFTVTGRSDATGCNLAQPNFSQAQSDNDLVFRRPIETFGDGLIEIVENGVITAQATAECSNQAQTGVCGTVSVDPHNGDVNRLGWKGQWRGLMTAAAEELNTEMGVTNEWFPTEINQTQGCVFNPVPESGTNFIPTIEFYDFTGDPERMTVFMSFLAPPIPANFSQAALQGQTEFNTIGCTNCHQVSYTTPAMSSMGTFMESKTINLYSDLLLHHMGNCLADNIVQGSAQGDMWRTPPLWGAGKRAFFMHDGRTSNLITAIEDHVWNSTVGTTCGGSYAASEATDSVSAYNALSSQLQQDVLDFIRDL